jgi:MATE family multidrug resistance protein
VVATMALFLLAPEALVSLYVDPDDPARPEVLRVGVMLLALAALFQLFDAAQVLALGLLRGMHDTRVPMVMAVISYWVVGAPAAYALGFPGGLGARGVWLGLTLGLVCASALLMWRFWRRTLPRFGTT